MYNYSLTKSKRKTISVSVNSFGDIAVRAPYAYSQTTIDKFINENSAWIDNKINKINTTMPDIAALKHFEYIYLLGKRYEIKFSSNKKIELTDDVLIVPDTNNKEIKLINWFKKFAAEYFVNRCEELYSKIKEYINKPYKNIKIINSKIKWGACKITGELYFNWRALLLAPDIIDYLIYHELCHLKFLNHSPEYWRLVNKITDVKKYRKQLKDKNYLILLYR